MLRDWSTHPLFLLCVLFYATGMLTCMWCVFVCEIWNWVFRLIFTLIIVWLFCIFMEGMLWLCTYHWDGHKLWSHSLSEFNPVNSYYLEFGQGGASCFQVWLCFFFLPEMNHSYNWALIVNYGYSCRNLFPNSIRFLHSDGLYLNLDDLMQNFFKSTRLFINKH